MAQLLTATSSILDIIGHSCLNRQPLHRMDCDARKTNSIDTRRGNSQRLVLNT